MSWDLLTVNTNFVHVASFLMAVGFAATAVVVNKVKCSKNPLNGTTIFLDLLRGASMFPLILFTVSPVLPEMGKLALTGDPVLVGLGAANGLFALVTDWWRNI